MKTKAATFWGIIGIGILWCAILLQTRNTLWFFIPAVTLLIIWLVYTRHFINLYLHPKAFQTFQNGVKCLDLSQFSKAKAFFDLSIQLYPNNAAVFNARGLAHVQLNEANEAIADANRAIQIKKNFANPYAVRAMAHLLNRNHDEAFKDCETAIRISPKSLFNYQVRGSIHIAQNDYDAAIVDFKTALEHIKPKAKTYQATIYSLIGYTYWLKGDYQQAIDHINNAIEIKPAFGLAYSYRAYIYADLNSLENAQNDSERAIILDHFHYHVYAIHGYVNFLKSLFIEALSDFQKSSSLKPRDKFAIAGQAICHYQLGQKDEAKQVWESLIKIDPEYTGIEALVKDYRPAKQFIKTTNELLVEIIKTHREK